MAGRTCSVPCWKRVSLPNFQNPHGVSLMQTCAYYGDVSAVRTLLTRGVSLQALGPNLGLSAACFHGHWRLCLLLLEHGANVNDQSEETKETPLHASLCTTDRILYDRVVEVLLSRGADPNLPAANGVATGGFMRDARTKGETALHRAAAFGDEGTVKMLLDAGARQKLTVTPTVILHCLGRVGISARRAFFVALGEHRVNPGRKSMRPILSVFLVEQREWRCPAVLLIRKQETHFGSPILPDVSTLTRSSCEVVFGNFPSRRSESPASYRNPSFAGPRPLDLVGPSP